MLALTVVNRAVVLDASLPLEKRADEVLLRPLLSGICRTDLELAQGYMDFSGIPGHEFVARVIEGSSRFRPGDLVVGEINCGCGSCALCRTGDARHCPERTVLGILNRPGAMAEYLYLPESNLHRVPDSVSPEEAVFTEPLAAACRIIEQNILPDAGAEIAVFGDGKLGLLVALTLDHFGYAVSLFGHHAERNRLILAGAGIRLGESPGKFPVVVDCTGRPEGITAALAHLAPTGTLVLKTTTALPPQFHLAQVVIDEFHVVGSRCGPFLMALDLLARRAVPVERLIDATYPLSQGETAFARAGERGRLKVLLQI